MASRRRKPAPSSAPPPTFLTWIAGQLSPASLDVIAGADYGWKTRENRAALDRLVAGGLAELDPLRWEPREVLELTRWDDVPPNAPDADARHTRRLFACTALLLAAALPSNRGRTHSINETLAAAVDSLLRVAPSQRAAFVAMLDELIARWLDDSVEQAYLHAARFIVLASLRVPAPLLADALAKATSIIATWRRECADSRYADLVPEVARRYGWLVDLSEHRQRYGLWRALLDDALAALREANGYADVCATLEQLAERRA